MLDFLRRFYEHTAGKIITVLVGLLFLVGFSFLPYLLGSGRGMSPGVVAVVSGKNITLDDLNGYYGRIENEYLHIYGKELTRQQLGELNLTGSALSSLIADKVLESNVGIFGLHVSDGFIARNIATYPEFSKNGRFSEKLFNSVLLSNHTSPAAFEESLKNRISRSYIKRIIADSFSFVNSQFINDYKIKNKSVSFNMALFTDKKTADAFLKNAVISGSGFIASADSSGAKIENVPLFSEMGLVKSSYFDKYSIGENMLDAIYSSPAGSVANGVFYLKTKNPLYAVIKIKRVYFPEYVPPVDKTGKKGTANADKQEYVFSMRRQRQFLDDYVGFLESKSSVKINKKVLSSFHPY